MKHPIATAQPRCDWCNKPIRTTAQREQGSVFHLLCLRHYKAAQR